MTDLDESQEISLSDCTVVVSTVSYYAGPMLSAFRKGRKPYTDSLHSISFQRISIRNPFNVHRSNALELALFHICVLHQMFLRSDNEVLLLHFLL